MWFKLSIDILSKYSEHVNEFHYLLNRIGFKEKDLKMQGAFGNVAFMYQ